MRCGHSGRDIRIAASPQAGLCGERAQLFFGQGALYAGLGEIVGGVFGKQGEYAADILVIYHTYYNM